MSTKLPAQRRKGSVARDDAVEAARALLLDAGPSAVTLKAVGQAMGVGHANLIHHFGSAAGLQAALMERMVRDLVDTLSAGLSHMRPGDWEPEGLLGVVFDAFDAGGAAQLAAWLALARESDRADVFSEVVRDLADRIARLAGDDPAAAQRAQTIVLVVTALAFADALIGTKLADIVEAPRGRLREISAAMLTQLASS